jgi:GDPmannose 4,6-dehydratase
MVAVTGDKAPAMKVGEVILRIDPRYFRPAEGQTLLCDPRKTKERLGWTSQTRAQEMCAELVAEDLKAAQRHALFRAHRHDVAVSLESYVLYDCTCAGARSALAVKTWRPNQNAKIV